MSVILASRSPRRRELLAALGIPFTVEVTDTDETLPAGTDPAEGVRILAVRKAEAIRERGENTVIAADTLVELDGIALGKPADRADAVRMLRALSDTSHRVHTGVAVLRGGQLASGTETTTVVFRKLTDAEIAGYVDSGEPIDKAGAYGIQGGASRFVSRIEGNLDCVIGLPSALLRRLLAEVEA